MRQQNVRYFYIIGTQIIVWKYLCPKMQTLDLKKLKKLQHVIPEKWMQL